MILGDQRHIVHPGYVKSKSDGDTHYIGFVQLCDLYGLNPRTSINADSPISRYPGVLGIEDRHFYPRNDGNYVRVQTEEAS